MGGRGAAGRAIAQHAARDGVSDFPLQPEDEPTPPTEQVPAGPPEADEPERPWWDETRSSKDWSPETVDWDTKLYDTLLTLSGRTKHDGTQWIRLADLRPALGGTREEQDANLKRLSRDGVIGLAPNSARMLLQQDDHDAAMYLGSEVQHTVSWDYSVYPDRPEARP